MIILLPKTIHDYFDNRPTTQRDTTFNLAERDLWKFIHDKAHDHNKILFQYDDDDDDPMTVMLTRIIKWYENNIEIQC